MKKSYKKIIAKEFLFLLGSTILFLMILFLWMFLKSRNEKKISQLTNKIELIEKEFEKTQINLDNILRDNSDKLYLFLRNRGKYTKSFEEFRIQFSSKEKQIKLYNALKNDGLYTKSQDEFIAKYFISSYDKNIDKKLKETLLIAKYNSASTDDLNEIIYRYKAESNEVYKKNIEKISELTESIIERRLSFFDSQISNDDLIRLGIIIISVMFGFRYLIYGTKWSFKQLKN